MPIPPAPPRGGAVPPVGGAVPVPPVGAPGIIGRTPPGAVPRPPRLWNPPPPKPTVAGPALGIDPVCAVVAVSIAYAAGPASPARTPTATTAAATERPTRS